MRMRECRDTRIGKKLRDSRLPSSEVLWIEKKRKSSCLFAFQEKLYSVWVNVNKRQRDLPSMLHWFWIILEFFILFNYVITFVSNLYRIRGILYSLAHYQLLIIIHCRHHYHLITIFLQEAGKQVVYSEIICRSFNNNFHSVPCNIFYYLTKATYYLQ